MPNAGVSTQDNTGAPPDFGPCPEHEGARLTRWNTGQQAFECEAGRHLVGGPVPSWNPNWEGGL